MLAPEQESALAAAIGRKAVIDLIAMVGFYSVLGYLLKTYDTPLDNNIQKEAVRKDPRYFRINPTAASV